MGVELKSLFLLSAFFLAGCAGHVIPSQHGIPSIIPAEDEPKGTVKDSLWSKSKYSYDKSEHLELMRDVYVRRYKCTFLGAGNPETLNESFDVLYFETFFVPEASNSKQDIYVGSKLVSHVVNEIREVVLSWAVFRKPKISSYFIQEDANNNRYFELNKKRFWASIFNKNCLS